ncbi:MAG: hypothetical protein AB1918_09410 [Pseudomonadota bacterium]
MKDLPELELVHMRLLWLIYNTPGGLTAAQLVQELKRRGWCEPWLTPADLGLKPLDVLHPPGRRMDAP